MALTDVIRGCLIEDAERNGHPVQDHWITPPPCSGVPMEVEGAYPPIETQADCADELVEI